MTPMNPKGFSIRIFVPEGFDRGFRVVEKSNWNGRGVICPRAHYTALRERAEFTMAGVYLLLGPGSAGDLPRVYVGEGDPIRPRLESHYAKKDFWTTALFFVSPDEKLNKAHVQYLESRLVELADAAKRCELDNATFPTLPSMSDMDAAEAEGFLDEVLLCLPLMGVTFFEQPPAQVLTRDVLYIKAKGIEARGYEATDGFVVLANSQAVAEPVPSCVGFVKDLRQTLLSRGIFKSDGVGWVLTRDYLFNSPSTAAGVMLGMTSNGRQVWKNASGKSLKEIQLEHSTPSAGKATTATSR